VQNTRTLEPITEAKLCPAQDADWMLGHARLSFGLGDESICGIVRTKGSEEWVLRCFDLAGRTVAGAQAIDVRDAKPCPVSQGGALVLTLDGVFRLDPLSGLSPVWARREEQIVFHRFSTTGRFAVGEELGWKDVNGTPAPVSKGFAVLDLATSPPSVHRITLDAGSFITTVTVADEANVVLVGGNRGRLYVRRFTDGVDLGVLHADKSKLRDIVVSADGRTMLTAGWDSTRLWRAVD
jgi:hypothetical protein